MHIIWNEDISNDFCKVQFVDEYDLKNIKLQNVGHGICKRWDRN